MALDPETGIVGPTTDLGIHLDALEFEVDTASWFGFSWFEGGEFVRFSHETFQPQSVGLPFGAEEFRSLARVFE